jgi:alpha-L-fucosidase 2
VIAGLLLTLLTAAPPADVQPLRLWYDKPTTDYMSGLPVGNGHIGAMVLGEPDHERIALNHQRLWRRKTSGRVNEPNTQGLAEFRRLMFDGKAGEANRRAGELLGWKHDGVDPYQPVGDLWIDWPQSRFGRTGEYRRQLDLSTGVVRTVSTGWRDMTFTREVFASRTDNAIVVHLVDQALRQGSSAEIILSRRADPECSLEVSSRSAEVGNDRSRRIRLSGRFPEGVFFTTEAVVMSAVGVQQGDGFPGGNEVSVRLSGAKDVTIILTMATADAAEGGTAEDAKRLAGEQLDRILRETRGDYPTLLARHKAEHQALFDRVKLRLGRDSREDIRTDRRLSDLKAGNPDPALEALYFHYGRYLLLSSSAPGGLPANLQGLWNEEINPPWQADYHTNINIQMNYWPAEVANLSECHDPLFDWTERAASLGKEAAKSLYGAGGTWIGQSLDASGRSHKQRGPWTEWTGAAPWLAQHFWWRYEYTLDKAFLQERAYPLMKEVAAFFQDYLVEDPRPDSKFRGRLVTVPSNSPENSYRVEGKGVTLAIGATMDYELIHDLLTHCIKASEILGVDADRRAEWKRLLERIPPLQIGKFGQLQEWQEDHEEAEPGHRHFSHLFGLFPGDQITLEKTPELAKAARVSLERRLAHSGGHTGWSRSWVVGFWARLREGDKAEEHLRHLITDFATISLLDLHPPRIFQIDGNFGGTAGIAEMLMQSHDGVIRLLPALPKNWPEGDVSGLVARGAVEVGVRWVNGKAVGATLKSKVGGTYRVLAPAGQKITQVAGKKASAPASDGTISVACPRGKAMALRFGP